MTGKTPKTAPKTAPKKVDEAYNGVPNWKNHWHSNYHDPRIVLYRGKYAIAVTKPPALQKKNDPDKKLSARTTDENVARQRMWEIAARIYAGFDEELADVDPQIERDKEFRKKAVKLLAKHGIKHPSITDEFSSDWFEIDDLVRLIHQAGVSIPDDMIELLGEEAKLYLTHLPSMAEQTEADKAAEAMFGKKEINVLETLEQMRKGLDYLINNPDAEDAELVHNNIKALSLEVAKHTPNTFTDLDEELAQRLKSGGMKKISSSIAEVSKRYLAENKWNRERTKSGAATALERFSNFHGGDTDINDFNPKHAYEFAQWMEDELDSANKSIKSSISYVKGMFSWAITQKDYTITEEPWGKLAKISSYGKAEESYQPFTRDQLTRLFNLVHKDKGRMNPREHLILSILITTGCRLDEAALLCWDNIIQDEGGWHYIDLTRALVKNTGSQRLLPIPDCLWSLFPDRGKQLTVEGTIISPDDRLFDYSMDADGKAARAASQACGRQLDKIARQPRQVTHSLRGNLKDLLRDVGVSKELNNYITGHGQGDVGGDRYGKGHSIAIRYEALNKVEHPWIQPYPS